MLSRFKIFFAHLVGSLVVGLVASVLVFWVWYPSPLHLALGVTSIFLFILVVDVTLGPFLTLVICKPGKRTLKMDLMLIVLIQLSALFYGLWTVSQGRPAWLVFNVDRFDVVQVVDIDARRESEALPEYRAPGWFGPKWIAALGPEDIERRNEILFEAVQGGSDIAQRPELYRSLAASNKQIRARAQSLDSLSQYNDPVVVADILAAWPQATGWLPLMARSQSMVVLLSDNNARVLAIVPLSPWL